MEDAWLFFHMMFELIWQYRFLYRDLNDLLSKNRRLETHFQFVLKNKSRAVEAVLDGLNRSSEMRLDRRDLPSVATSMVVVLTYWLSYEYVRDPRKALEPEQRRRDARARRLARAEPADALPRARRARAPADAGRRLQVLTRSITSNRRDNAMAKWTAFPYDAADYTYDAAALKKHWARLHKGDAEPFPKDEAVLAAWALFHAGEFQKAHDAGLKAGDAGHRRREQGAVHLRQLPRDQREDQARDVHGSGRTRRGAGQGRSRSSPTRTTGRPTRWAATARASAWPRR